jgi:hypothetical protein
MAGESERKGCLAGGTAKKPKHRYPSAPAAWSGLRWMVEYLGCHKDSMRVYQCRYSPANDPHWHVGHKPRETGQRQQYGRMPEDGGNHRR